MKLQKTVIDFLMIGILCGSMQLFSMAGTKNIFDAIDKDLVDSVAYWLDHGISIQTKNDVGQTPLEYAVLEKRLKVIPLLLARATNTLEWNRTGMLLNLAVIDEDNALVRVLLNGGVSTDVPRGGSSKLLTYAINRKNIELTQLLLDKTANIEAKNDLGNTPLEEAISSGVLKIVQLLLDKGANIEARDKNGKTALEQAIDSNQLEIVKLFLDKGAPLDDNLTKKIFDKFAPSYPNKLSYRKIATELLDHARHNDNLALVIFDLALKNNDHKFMQSLVEKGFDIERPNNQGETNLMRTITEKDYNVITFLIQSGANPNLKDKAGIDAFGYAKGDKKILAILNKKTQEEIKEDFDGSSAAEDIPAALAQEQLTPTELHYNKFRADIEKKYGNDLKDPHIREIVQECIRRERLAYQQNKYVFYRSEPGQYRVYEYFLNGLYQLVRPQGKKRKSFIFTRFFKDIAQQQTINQYIDTKPWQAHRQGGQFNVLLSANIPLFGNIHNSGSCTWNYFLKNVEATGGVTLSDMLERIFDLYAFDRKYIQTLLDLHEGVLKNAASLQQIIIPKNIVDNVVMFATHGYCFPWQDVVDASCWDPNAISVKALKFRGEVPQTKHGRHTCIASIIDKYKNGEIEIDDAWQARILMNALFNPASGIEFNLYTRLPAGKEAHFEKQVKEITDTIFGEWLAQQVKRQNLPAGMSPEEFSHALRTLNKEAQEAYFRAVAARRGKEEERKEEENEATVRKVRETGASIADIAARLGQERLKQEERKLPRIREEERLAGIHEQERLARKKQLQEEAEARRIEDIENAAALTGF